ncbi:MAG: oligosaccharide flippase family protein [Candidatus Omnitrophica bacterium]|nr:oligosaccharide flippase family protein [Candidatus Omnitrophota bacterium]
MKKKSFIKNAGIMFIATTLSGIFNLLYQLFMIRALAPIDFGLLDKLLGLTIITAMPTGTLQAVVTKFIASYKAEKKYANIRDFLRMFLSKLGLVGIGILLVFVIFRSNISAYYKTDNDFLIVIVGFLLFASTLFPLNIGALQGLEKFKSLGTASLANSLLRLGFGILLVNLGFRVGGALTALIIASVATILISFIPLRKYFLFKPEVGSKDSDPNLNLKDIAKYCFPAFIALFSFALLTNMDLQLISPYFSAEDAGYFAVARMIGKIILYLPGAVTIVMFPKIAAEYTQNKDTTGTLKKSLLVVGLMCSVAGAICIMFPNFILKTLAGAVYPECIPLVMPFVVSMSFYALCSVFLYYYLSVHNMKFIYIAGGFVFIQAGLIKVFHNSLIQVMYMVCFCAIGLFVINLFGLKRKNV